MHVCTVGPQSLAVILVFSLLAHEKWNINLEYDFCCVTSEDESYSYKDALATSV